MNIKFTKRSIPIVWAVLFSTISFGQTVIDRIDQHTDIVHYDEVFSLSDDSWLFSGRGNLQGGLPSGRYFLTKCNNAGNPIWRFGHSLMSGYWNLSSPARAKHISVLSDDGVLVIGVIDGCDFLTGQLAAYRLTSNGELMWHTEINFGDFNNMPTNDAGIFTRLADGPSLNHAIASSDSIIILNDSGAIMHRWLAPALPVHCLRWENDTTILIGAGDKIFRTHADGTVVLSSSLNNAEYTIDIRTRGNQILALTSSHVEVFSSALEFSHLIPIQTQPYGFVDANNEVWLSAGGVLFRVEDNGLPPLLNTGINSMAYNNDLIMTASSAGHHYRFGGRMKSYLMDGTNVNHTDDVELIITIDSTTAQGQQYDAYLGPIYDFRAHATVKIINHSANILNKVVVSHFSDEQIAVCGTPGQTIISNNLNLAPNDTASITFNNLYLDYRPYTGYSTLTRTICLVALSPNEHLDIFTDDNQHCLPVTFTVPVGIENETQSIASLQIHPNPTTGTIFLPQQKDLQWELMDVSGRILAKGTNASSLLNLRNHTTVEGLYLLRMTGNGATKTERIMLIQP